MKNKRGLLIGMSVLLASSAIGALVANENKNMQEISQQNKVEEKNSVLVKKITKQVSDERDALYSIGSVSKVFTSVAIMQLVEAGKVNLDEPIVTYLPEFKMADDRYKQITVRMLLNHSSGLMGSTYSNSILYGDNDTLAHDTLLEKLSTQRLKADPGLYSTYCNDGFVLAEMIVEKVSGQSFTQYLEKNIFTPLEMNNSGTSINLFNDEMQVGTYFDSMTKYAADYCNVIGTGGIISTSEELCKFGSIFTKDYSSLLTQESIDEMGVAATQYTHYGYVGEGSADQYGLGWDCVDAYPFNQYDIKALVKGGDTLQQHGMLMVLPEENISVSVLSSGGGSSFNELLAQELAMIALEESGTILAEETSTNIDAKKAQVVKQVPESYLKYEGIYANNAGTYKISFPNKAYLQLETCDEDMPKTQYYYFTEDGNFIAEDYQYINIQGITSPSAYETGSTTLSLMTETDGKMYLCMETILNYAEIGETKLAGMYAQKMESNELKDTVTKAWEARNGKKYYLVSEKYSSGFWLVNPTIKLELNSKESGYINAFGKLTPSKIIDSNKAEAFLTLTGAMGRDLNDISMIHKDGSELLYLEDTSMYYIEENQIPELDLATTEMKLKESSANWYHIGEQVKGQTITLIPSDKMAVYLYDKYDECVYSSYMENREGKVILPEDGKLVVIGEAGSELLIKR
ncbi:MAG: beta-lactamase family protein [Cellulosilyticum sp.]|nr:beta-lactamase family protein [Cellulosilyticum sp.]